MNLRPAALTLALMACGKTLNLRAAALSLALTACGKTFPPPLPNVEVAMPPVDSVESVLFFLGDAGNGSLGTSPLLHRLQAEVEYWAASLPDSSVMVLFLGDNVYPAGVHDENDPAFPQDSTRLQGQIDVVASELARKQGVRGVFIPGNHDWGHMPGERGRIRLFNMQRLVARRAYAGHLHVEFQPPAGDPGPFVARINRRIKVLLIDSAWWLLEPNHHEKELFLERLDSELTSRDGRDVIIAAHHPWLSGSAHGGLVPFWQSIGVQWLLSRSGALLQDLNSLPYRELKNQFTSVFQRTGPPLIFVGGHDHNLQVIRATHELDPYFSLVSGAGSKSSKVGPTDGYLYNRAAPGFMQLVVLKDGSMDLFIIAGDLRYLRCPEKADALRVQCLEDGVHSFQTVFTTRLK